jgi:RNA polymerase sigma factor (sigma-70 family)
MPKRDHPTMREGASPGTLLDRPGGSLGGGAASAPLRSDRFLEQAMEQWGDAVLRLALSQMRHRADAEDVFQDVFLRLMKDQTSFTSDEHLKAWLLRTTLNRCHDLQRKGRHRAAEPLTACEPAEEDAALEALLGSEVWEAVGALPADLRACIHLFYVEGYPTADIARLLGCEPATVRTRLHRARQALRAQLEAMRRQPPAPLRPADAPSVGEQKMVPQEAWLTGLSGPAYDDLPQEGGFHGQQA